MYTDFWKAAGIRALRSFLQAIIIQIPTGVVITPAMIQYFDISYLYMVLAVILNAALYAFASVATSILTGLPEVDITHEVTNEEASIQIEEGDPEYYEYNEEVDEDE